MIHSVATLLNVEPLKRRERWLRHALQLAIEVEFFTIPPYLTAMWSIKNGLSEKVYVAILNVVRQEMSHMGVVCNVLTGLGGMPRIAHRKSVPRYPGHFHGGVHPELTVGLRPLSKPLVEHVFMKIEEPEGGPITWYRGEAYPTIGAFYDAITDALLTTKPKIVELKRQQEIDLHNVTIPRIRTLCDALEAVALIKKQGEGTRTSPYFTPVPEPLSLAHYYRFGEVFHEKRIKNENGHWVYKGATLKFPKDIYPMAPIPFGGYTESRDFDLAYTAMLHDLQAAWEKGSPKKLQCAIDRMTDDLGGLATGLMAKPIGGVGPHTYGPSFLLL